MMNNDPTLNYQQGSACGASPIGQIVALYDTILRDFGRALVALQAGDIEARVFELNHAIVVIGYLQYILDHEHGGEPAKRFEQFYNVTRGLTVQANCKATPEPVEELIELFSGVRQAWYQAEQKMQAAQGEQSVTDGTADAAAPGASSASKEGAETSQLQWSA
jgi:flagellar secretion chaperone FliS